MDEDDEHKFYKLATLCSAVPIICASIMVYVSITTPAFSENLSLLCELINTTEIIVTIPTLYM